MMKLLIQSILPIFALAQSMLPALPNLRDPPACLNLDPHTYCTTLTSTAWPGYQQVQYWYPERYQIDCILEVAKNISATGQLPHFYVYMDWSIGQGVYDECQRLANVYKMEYIGAWLAISTHDDASCEMKVKDMNLVTRLMVHGLGNQKYVHCFYPTTGGWLAPLAEASSPAASTVEAASAEFITPKSAADDPTRDASISKIRSLIGYAEKLRLRGTRAIHMVITMDATDVREVAAFCEDLAPRFDLKLLEVHYVAVPACVTQVRSIVFLTERLLSDLSQVAFVDSFYLVAADPEAATVGNLRAQGSLEAETPIVCGYRSSSCEDK